MSESTQSSVSEDCSTARADCRLRYFEYHIRILRKILILKMSVSVRRTRKQLSYARVLIWYFGKAMEVYEKDGRERVVGSKTIPPFRKKFLSEEFGVSVRENDAGGKHWNVMREFFKTKFRRMMVIADRDPVHWRRNFTEDEVIEILGFRRGRRIEYEGTITKAFIENVWAKTKRRAKYGKKEFRKELFEMLRVQHADSLTKLPAKWRRAGMVSTTFARKVCELHDLRFRHANPKTKDLCKRVSVPELRREIQRRLIMAETVVGSVPSTG